MPARDRILLCASTRRSRLVRAASPSMARMLLHDRSQLLPKREAMFQPAYVGTHPRHGGAATALCFLEVLPGRALLCGGALGGS